MVKNIVGQKFGKLTVIEQHGFTKPNKYNQRHAIWYCKCECGSYVERTTDVLKRGKSSCGCLQKEILEDMANRNITHGMSNTRLYHIFKGMQNRCYYKKSQRYNCYGGRGIKICDEWLNDKEKFFKWALENGYRDNLTIERINVDGDYCPSNCKWISMSEQYKNKQSNGLHQPLPEPYKESEQK